MSSIDKKMKIFIEAKITKYLIGILIDVKIDKKSQINVKIEKLLKVKKIIKIILMRLLLI